jgi:hypothetical protein
MLLIVAGIYLPSATTVDNKYSTFLFNIYGISIALFILDLLNKGLRLQIIVDFPKDTISLLRYLSFKYKMLAIIIYIPLLFVMNIFFSIELFNLTTFYICIIYLSLSYYLIFCLYFGKRTNLSIIDALVLSFILLITLAILNIILYLIKVWIIIPILAIAILFNLIFLNKISLIIAPVIYEILENSNESD